MADEQRSPAEGASQTELRERLGRYALGRSLGRGGMGEVFRARAFGAEGVVKELCVKRIRTERLARPGALAQFVAEARLWMRLHHGNIVTVFDFGRAGAEYYLAMEWVDGADVRALLDDARRSGEPLPASTAAHVAGEVARALAYAHAVRDEQGSSVVHRDVKPANVLISRSGDVRLTDFGVAGAALDATSSGPHAGTPAYMAPEQRRGESLDARADLYSLGVVLYEMLTGARPTDGALTLPASTPEDIADIVTKLLEERADARPDGAASVARSLEAAVGRAHARGGDPSPRDELGRRAARVADGQRGHDDDTTGELSADASFADARAEDLPSLTHSTASAPARVAAARAARAATVPVTGAAAAERTHKPTTTRRTVAAIIALLALALSSLAVYGALTNGDARRGTSPRPTPEGARATRPLEPAAPQLADTSAQLERATTPVEQATTPAEQATTRVDPAATPVEQATTRVERSTAPPSPRPRGEGRGEIRGEGGEASEPCVLNVNAAPWAEVWIDGVSRGTTPLFGASLAPGRHSLRFVNAPLGVERETTVTLAPGERRDLVVDLVPAQIPANSPSVMHIAREK